MRSFCEIVMLVCFGAAWPFAIYKSATTREVGSKSLLFLCVILVGYAAGILHKLASAPDAVTLLYALNGAMVLTDILLYLRNRRYHIRRSAREGPSRGAEW